jgi:radical SAM superfamily enzyme YgiQ (UPF0313 family)
MRFLFINMPIRESAKPNNVPLGIYYLIASLNKYHAEDGGPNICTRVIDFNVWRPFLCEADVRTRIAMELPADVVCLSGLITTVRAQRLIAGTIKDMCPSAKIISGGGLATNLKHGLFDIIPEIDSICVGEGDESIRRIARDALMGDIQRVYRWPVPMLDTRPEWGNVFGIEDYIRNPIWGTDANNSSAAPGITMKRSLNMITSRGCPYRCAFCSHEASGGANYRMRRAIDVVNEFCDLSAAHSLDFIGFVDDNIGVYSTRLEQICDMLVERGGNVRWGSHVRFGHVEYRKLLERMFCAGCRYLGFGGESASPEVLASMHKGNNIQTMKDVLAECRSIGIHPNVTWMMGWPGETREQVRATARFIMKYAPENPKMFVATAYPGTALWDMVDRIVLDRFGTLGAYVEQLGDATLPLVNYSAMPDDEFFEVARYATAGELEKI